jgi:G3E family GTPase
MAETSWEEAMARPPAVQRDFSKGDPSGLKRVYLVSDGFESFSFEAEQPFAADKFQHFLERLSHDVFRAKGLLWIAESKKPYVFHLVGQRFTLDESRRPGPMKNRLVQIGCNLNRQALRDQLEGCHATW